MTAIVMARAMQSRDREATMKSAALGALTLLSFLHPSESQLAVLPGEHAEVILYVEGASSQEGAELTASTVDWHADNDGVISYADAGVSANSASAWLSTNPKVVSV